MKVESGKFDKVLGKMICQAWLPILSTEVVADFALPFSRLSRDGGAVHYGPTCCRQGIN